jgi:hypothetical protein
MAQMADFNQEGYRSEVIPYEELPMTLQIGLVGREGIVLASDRCRIMIQNGARQTSQVSKYVLSAKHVFAYAGDDVAEEIANQLSVALDADPNGNPCQIGQIKVKNLGKPIPNPCAVIGIAQGQLWHLSFGMGRYSGTPIVDKVVTGDSVNPAIFFSERYYPDLQDNFEGLKKLAAHVIRVGGVLNPAGVQGLEMLLWNSAADTLRRVGDREIQELCEWSEKQDGDIGKTFAT